MPAPILLMKDKQAAKYCKRKAGAAVSDHTTHIAQMWSRIAVNIENFGLRHVMASMTQDPANKSHLQLQINHEFLNAIQDPTQIQLLVSEEYLEAVRKDPLSDPMDEMYLREAVRYFEMIIREGKPRESYGSLLDFVVGRVTRFDAKWQD